MHRIPLHKTTTRQPDYKTNCILGDDHPLECPQFVYQITTIGRIEREGGDSAGTDDFTIKDIEFIEAFSKRPEVDWALDNSLDGLYVEKMMRADSFATVYIFSAYLKEEHITFWKLKYI